ncbi:MAG: circularly permuted type 2 ATP-grasp protein [Akkermansiaceae bacterium]|nr:circularly permuted type 2 ATP-grasp protein [Akkermansiaceae bacterium]
MYSQSQSSGNAPEGEGLFASYQPKAGIFDEYTQQTGEGRALWKTFASRINALGEKGLISAWRRGEEILRENGISFDLMSSSSESLRRWNLDPIPLVLSQQEWAHLSKSAIQRATLLDHILKDCYGPQKLIKSGILPHSFLYSQLEYHRSMSHRPLSDPPLLSFYAVDIARGPNGNWIVLADRAEAPNGTGFALENRIVLSNVFPETSKRMNLIRLASFFQDFSANLRSLAPPSIDDPKIVMLSPGAGDKTYFEDAFLTRYLGITLAVGSELTVRNDRLYLKTVRGLQMVHVLIRRIQSNDADPLDTPTSNYHGVPGLMQVIHSGNVTIVNPPGTGLVEAPALLPYLPEISKFFLGENLHIPSIETAYHEPMQDLVQRLRSESLVVKSAYSRKLFQPIITRQLNPSQLEKLKQNIQADPARYVIQREMPFSTAPSWTGNRIEPRPVAIRLFLFAENGTYHVMPGGLVRAASQAEALPGLSLHENTSSKDLWICSTADKPNKLITNIPSRVSVLRKSGTLSSHAADNMLWIGRYSERSEYATRVLLEIVLTAVAEQDNLELPAIPPLIKTLGKLNYIEKSRAEAYTALIDHKQLLEDLTEAFFETNRVRPPSFDSVPQNLTRLLNLAAHSRDRLSNETWRIIQNLDGLVRTVPPRVLSSFRSPLQQAILLHSAFNGTCRENITRSESWRFLNIGRRIERSSWLVTIVEQMMADHSVLTPPLLDAMLSISDCTMTYRFRYQGAPQPLPALDLILFDPQNPRSLAYQLADLDQSFCELPPPKDTLVLRPAHRTIRKALNYLQTEVLQANDAQNEALILSQLKDFISQLRKDLPAVHEQLSWEFFTHAAFTAS